MCRLYGFISNEPTKVDCSLVFGQNALILQSRVDQMGRDHADGWGIATYEQGRPVVHKKTTAAYDDQHFSATAEKIYSQTIVAHIRKATVGNISVNNTHPFTSGRWAFAHNGTITGFEVLGPQLAQETLPHLQVQRIGQTDSEQYFLWILSHLIKSGLDTKLNEPNTSRQVIELLENCVSSLDDRCLSLLPDKTPRLNFVLTDGNTLMSCRWNHTMHLIQRNGIYDCEICGIPHIHHHETIDHRAVAIASEPLTHENWVEVENKSCLLFNVNGSVSKPATESHSTSP